MQNELSGSVKRLGDNHHVLFRSAHVEWGTPPDLYAALDAEFHFTLDPCAVGSVWDGREISWTGQRVFCNPPYGRKAKVDRWLARAREAEIAVYLLPARTDTSWFHDHALKADEIRFFRGRLHFTERHIRPKEKWLEGAPFPSMLVIFRKS
jgi:site-specific DNA-methyltransferase (adenine-specific)